MHRGLWPAVLSLLPGGRAEGWRARAWGILYILKGIVFPDIALSTLFYTPQLSGGDSFTFQRLYRPLYLPFALKIVQIITKHMV